jgi:DNA-directed RNA polymerase specialized sigma24 family protein
MLPPVVFLTMYRTGPARLLMLLRRTAADDLDAFTRLYEALLPGVVARVCDALEDAERIEEVTAATFLEVWQSAEEHTEAGTDVAGWVTGIAARRAAEPVDPRARSHPSQDTRPSGETLGTLLGRRAVPRRPRPRRGEKSRRVENIRPL